MGSDFGSNPSLKQLVYDNLKERIINGTLKPGMRLREEDLSNEMNISRAPIREALNMLERDGFTTIVPRKGALVSEVKKEDLYYIWELRALLEPYAAKISTKKIPEEKIQEVKKILESVLKEPDNMQRYMDSDLEVHNLMIDYLDNNFLKTTIQSMKAHSLRLRWLAEFSNDTQEATVLAATKDHLDIVHAMENRDADQVFLLVKKHVANSEKRLSEAEYGEE